MWSYHIGLSPRVRGNQVLDISRIEFSGSIPACAGGTPHLKRRYIDGEGLSPRVRGNPDQVGLQSSRLRSIPACAGEPKQSPERRGEFRVYPRVCGRTFPHMRPPHFISGLSPACAGEPSTYPGCPPRLRVYPRVCGGNPMLYVGILHRVRSIPACAGEPNANPNSATSRGVYPRVCGGTAAASLAWSPSQGLSPRVRGNLGLSCRPWQRQGSIPACAGEPTTSTKVWPSMRVYPRVCGGTAQGLHRHLNPAGLSPRVRGNLLHCPQLDVCRGSIPACAGEPLAN